VVVPVDEMVTRVLSESVGVLPAVVAGPTASQYAALCDKGALARNAARAGVGHPPGVLVTAEGPSGPWPPLPSIVKARISVIDTAGVPDLMRVDTAAGRDGAVGALVEAGVEVVVEERIVAPQWTVTGVRDVRGAVRAIAGRVVRTFPRGTGMPSVIETAPSEAALDAFGRILGSVGYHGPANVQMFERDGRMLVHDVNLRLPAATLLTIRAGLDLPALGVRAAMGEPLPETVRPFRMGLRYVSLGDELRAITGRGEGPGPTRRAAALELARAIASPRTLVDPPLRDPLWLPALAAEPARRVARRALGRVRPGGVARQEPREAHGGPSPAPHEPSAD